MHRLQLVHTDLKPENIGIKHHSRLSVRILDFGTAIRSCSTPCTYIQTRFYRAPEVVLGLPVDASADMWSLGCILVEMATGQILFPAANECELLDFLVGTLGHPPAALVRRGTRSHVFFDQKCQFIPYSNRPPRALAKVLQGCDRVFVEFIRRILVWNSRERLTAAQALCDPWMTGSFTNSSDACNVTIG